MLTRLSSLITDAVGHIVYGTVIQEVLTSNIAREVNMDCVLSPKYFNISEVDITVKIIVYHSSTYHIP